MILWAHQRKIHGYDPAFQILIYLRISAVSWARLTKASDISERQKKIISPLNTIFQTNNLLYKLAKFNFHLLR